MQAAIDLAADDEGEGARRDRPILSQKVSIRKENTPGIIGSAPPFSTIQASPFAKIDQALTSPVSRKYSPFSLGDTTGPYCSEIKTVCS